MKSEILLPVPELKTALSGLSKIIGRKTTLPVLGCVKVSRHSGLVTLQGTDLDGFATYTLNNTQAGEAVAVLVPLEQLTKALKCSSSKETVAVVVEGKSTKLRYNIAGNPVEQPANTLPVDEWPPVPKITADSTKLDPAFGLALKQALASCSEDPTRQVLRGACLDARDKSHYVVGTNGRMLYSANSFNFLRKDSIIIPDSKFITGSGLLDSECSIAIQAGKKPSDIKQICLNNQQWQLITREVEGKYPNWKQCVPTVDSKWTKLKLLKPAIEQLLAVLPNLPGKDSENSVVRLRIEKVLWIEGKNKDDADWTKIAVADVEVSGKSQVICLNRDYVVNALKFGLDEWFVLDELTPLVAIKDGKKVVIMPVRPPVQTALTKPTPTPTPSAPPPEAEVKPVAEERKTEMNTPMTAPERGNLKPVPAETNATKDALEKVETLKLQLRDFLSELTDLTSLLKAAEKEKRSQDKEVASVRQTIKSLQGVKI